MKEHKLDRQRPSFQAANTSNTCLVYDICADDSATEMEEDCYRNCLDLEASYSAFEQVNPSSGDAAIGGFQEPPAAFKGVRLTEPPLLIHQWCSVSLENLQEADARE